jgi:hypothetical protein
MKKTINEKEYEFVKQEPEHLDPCSGCAFEDFGTGCNQAAPGACTLITGIRNVWKEVKQD